MKIIAVGMNYALHNREMNNTLTPSEPVIFMKPDSALLKDGKPFFLPYFSSEIHYETEIVFRIQRVGKHIAEQYAHRYYEDITVGIDFTARDLQTKLRNKSLPWELSKGFDQSAAIGEFIPINKAGNIQQLDFRLEIDGQTVQSGNTADMIFTVDRIISYVSRYCTLKTGDLIYTGTPAGVGAVAIGNHLQGYIGDRKLLDFHIR